MQFDHVMRAGLSRGITADARAPLKSPCHFKTEKPAGTLLDQFVEPPRAVEFNLERTTRGSHASRGHNQYARYLPNRPHDPIDPHLRQEEGFVVSYPEGHISPFIFNSPHSGRFYTPHFLNQSRLSPLLLRRSEDALIDYLYQFAPDLGAPLMMATFPRAYLDLNREPYELDPKLIKDPLPDATNSRSVRVAAGLGTVARVVGTGLDIYRSTVSLHEALERIDFCYFPYHQKLSSLINAHRARFDDVVLIDCHSMPSLRPSGGRNRYADVIIGDRHQQSAIAEIVECLVRLFEAEGLSVGLNSPFAGGFITEHYGKPGVGVHAIQVELNRSLYMNEVTLEPHQGFSALQNSLASVFRRFVREFQRTDGLASLAAE